jgi:hypothetical protein
MRLKSISLREALEEDDKDSLGVRILNLK